MKKFLPINYPFITSYSDMANILSILLAIDNKEKESIYNWLYTNHLNIWIEKTTNYDPIKMLRFTSFERYECPFFAPNNLYLESTKILNYDLIKIIKAAIDSGYYLLFYYNKNLVNNIPGVFMHEGMIFGYDDIEKNVTLADFYNKYEYVKLSYKSIEQAICKYDLHFSKPQINKYEYNLLKILSGIEDFLEGKFNSKKIFSSSEEKNIYKNNISFGFSCFETLKESLEQKLDNIAYLTAFHALYDFCVLMEYRLEWLEEKEKINLESLIKLNRNLKEHCLLLRNMHIKHQMKKTDRILSDIINNIDVIKYKFCDLYEKIYKTLRVIT